VPEDQNEPLKRGSIGEETGSGRGEEREAEDQDEEGRQRQ